MDFDEINTHERAERYTALVWMAVYGIVVGCVVGGAALVAVYGIVRWIRGR